MIVVEGIEALESIPTGAVVTIGNYDGIHRGHQAIFQRCHELRTAGEFVVITFEPHPLTVLRPEMAPPRLTTGRAKLEILERHGVDRVVVLPPTPNVLGLTAEAFWGILRDHAKVSQVVEGTTFSFGKGRGGTIENLRKWSAGTGIGVHIVEPYEVVLLDLSIVPVSSSLVRWMVSLGRVRDAAIGLGRPFVLEGMVVEGYRRGRTIGVPTANLDCAGLMIPMEGVYAGRCEVKGRVYGAAVSVGRMETFGKDLRHQVEAHLVGFDGDLYGQHLRVELVDWVREQRKFNGIEALKAGIARDIEAVVGAAGIEPGREIALVSPEG